MPGPRFSIAVAVLALTATARAQCSPEWIPDQTLQGIGDSVFASTVWDPDGPGPRPPLLVLGGDFTFGGDRQAAHVIAWNGTGWESLGGGLAGPDSGVYALAVSRGRLIAAGQFTSAGGAPARNIAAWDGSGWTALGSGLPSLVTSLTNFNGDLIAGGWFQLTSGAPKVARWDGTSWQSVGSSAYSGAIEAVAVYDGALFAGGYGQLVRLDGAVWHDVAGAADGYVNALLPFDGRLVIAGDFTMIGGQPLNMIAAWDGAAMQPLGGGLARYQSDVVLSLADWNGCLYAGGILTNPSSPVRHGIGRWDGSSWTDVGGGLRPMMYNYTSASTLAVYGGDLVVAGNLGRAGDRPAANIASWDGSAWREFGSGIDQIVSTLATAGGELFAGGHFTSLSGRAINHIARRDAGGWQPLGSGLDGDVLAIGSFRGDLIAAGTFSNAGGQPALRIARWDGATWSPLGGGIGTATSGGAIAMTISGGDLIVAGQFQQVGGQPANNIARWDGAQWSPLGPGLTPSFSNGGVTALASDGVSVYAAGSFAGFAGYPYTGLARWDGSTWQAVLGSATPPTVKALAVHNGKLYVAGAFVTPDGQRILGVAQWDGSAWTPVGSGPPWNGVPAAITFVGDDLIVGGDFTSAAGVPAVHIARWDGADWSTLGPGITPGAYGNGGFGAIAAVGRDLWVGGSLTGAGGAFAAYLARWSCPCYANCDNSMLPPVLNVTDFICFLNQFAAGSAYANCDGSSSPPLSAADFMCFLARFAEGCP